MMPSNGHLLRRLMTKTMQKHDKCDMGHKMLLKLVLLVLELTVCVVILHV